MSGETRTVRGSTRLLALAVWHYLHLLPILLFLLFSTIVIFSVGLVAAVSGGNCKKADDGLL
jgi:hypothetical protein